MSVETSNRLRSGMVRWLPLAVLITLAALVLLMGWHRHLSFKMIGLNYEVLRHFIEARLVAALLIYVATYIAVVALSLPGGLVMTLSGGLLFGWKLNVVASVVGATIGASIVFQIAKTSFGETLAARAGPWLGRLRREFREHAFSYILFLRLVPVFPFVVINVAPALLGVPLRTFAIATLLGIIPGTLAFSVAGSGLGSAIEAQNRLYMACMKSTPVNREAICSYTIDTSALMTPELLVAFLLLAILAVIPIAFQKWGKRHAEA